MKLIKSIALFALSAMIVSCNRVDYKPQHVTNLYDPLAHWGSTDSTARDSIFRADSVEFKAMFSVLGADKPTDSLLTAWSSSPAVKIFTPAVDSVYPTLHLLEKQLGSILYNAKVKDLDLPHRRYATVVWGNMKSIVFTDSVMLIALNHYLGADYSGYQHRWPAYARHEKTPENLPYDIAEALVATRYPYKAEHNSTVLSRMLYEGALICAKLALVPESNLAAALGYTDKELQWVEMNSGQLWQSIISKRLLYDTSEMSADKLVERAPATNILSPEAPGRVGRYMGYAIICAYLEQDSKTTLLDMLSPDFYHSESVLIESGFSGD